ncbi:MAG: hypothetical protein Q8Q09_04065 [Deltaproteobacteria bacterium]|nr:hypothetical protein [Deltaproteobacteria bacterium]
MSKNTAEKSATTTSSNNDFVRTAIREKAEREMLGLTQRLEAFGGIERARDALHQITSDITAANAGYASLPVIDAATSTKLKKLKKLAEDALALATELGDVLGVDAEREALLEQRAEIEQALLSVGIDPASLHPAHA